jgi:Major Facilitator Superfamily
VKQSNQKTEDRRGTIKRVKEHQSYKKIRFNLIMMFFAWTAMSFGTNLLTFYTKRLPGEVYQNSMVIGLASLVFIFAGRLGQKYKLRHILSSCYIVALFGAVIMCYLVVNCKNNSGGMCDSLAGIVFLTRCGLNMANCFIFVIHTELFPTYFLATSYGLCNFIGRGMTLAAPILAESENPYLPLIGLICSVLLGVIGTSLIRETNPEELEGEAKTNEEDGVDECDKFDQLINTSII